MMNIQLKEIQILPIKPKDGLVAFASFVLNDQFYIGDVAIHTTPNADYRLVYPAKTLPNGKRINCFHPINREAGEALRWAITNKYKELIMDFESGKVVKQCRTVS